MIVVDASVLADALTHIDERGSKARIVLDRDTEWTAPEHWKAEVFSVMRGLVLGNKISESRALSVIQRLPQLAVDHEAYSA